MPQNNVSSSHNFYSGGLQTKSVNAPNFMNLYASSGSNVFEEMNVS